MIGVEDLFGMIAHELIVAIEIGLFETAQKII